MKYIAALLLAAVAVSARKLPEEQWRPAKSRDTSKLKPVNIGLKATVPYPFNGVGIVGGQEATPHQFPHQAAIVMDNSYFCGGALIDPGHILTAAHCVSGFSTWDIMLGAHNQRAPSEEGRIEITSRKAMTHPQWSSRNLHNDLAIITLPSAAPINDIIKAVPLAAVSPATGTTVTVSGWGKTSDNSGVADVLHYVSVPTISNEECDVYGGIMWEGMICTSGAGGKGSCNGDSGGPLINSAGEEVGIVSYGSAAGCEKGYPDAFTRVSYYKEWIEENSIAKF